MAKCAWRLLVSGLVLGGMAFTTVREVNAQDGSRAPDVQNDNDYFEWIGLAGLAGLFGLMRRDRHDNDRQRTTPGGRA